MKARNSKKQKRKSAGQAARVSGQEAEVTGGESGKRSAQNDGAQSVQGSTNAPGANLSGAAAADGDGSARSKPTAPTIISSARSLLLPYQRRWADDEARFKMGLMARQTGKDFSSGEEGIRDCYRAELNNSKATWLIGAASERQALESLAKWREWTEAYQLEIADLVEDREHPEALMKSTTIVFPRGSRVVAVPANPNTVRGMSANVLLTEFAFIENQDATWRAILPSITNPLRGGEKKVRLISTPNGVGNKFHELWKKNYQQPGKWSCHFVDIYTAVKEGLPVNIEELREALDDAEGFAQEFECLFLDTASVLLPYDLIALCESIDATETIPPEYWAVRDRQFPVDLGIDFGRKRDLTVCWAAERIADLQVTKEVLALEKMPTPDQVDILRPRIQAARRVCLDYSGPGIGMGDYLVKEFGEWNPDKHLYGKVELCTFTNTLKVELFSKLRMAFEKRAWRIPSSRVVREDLHSVSRVATVGGLVTYRAVHSPDGHADRCTALALCTRAGAGPAGVGFTATLI